MSSSSHVLPPPATGLTGWDILYLVNFCLFMLLAFLFLFRGMHLAYVKWLEQRTQAHAHAGVEMR